MQEIVNFLGDANMWTWFGIGIFLIIAEVFIPGTFIMWFGFGALLTGLIVGLIGGFSVASQLFIFSIMSIVSLIIGFFVYGKVFGLDEAKKENTQAGAQRFIGKTYIVSEDIRNGKGKVTVGDTVWLARSKKKIAKGTEVVVTGVDGTELLVEAKE